MKTLIFNTLIILLLMISFQLKADYPLYKHWHFFEEDAVIYNIFADENGNLIVDGRIKKNGAFNGIIETEKDVYWILSLDSNANMNWLRYAEVLISPTAVVPFTGLPGGISYHILRNWESGDMGGLETSDPDATMILFGLDENGEGLYMNSMIHNNANFRRCIPGQSGLACLAWVRDSIQSDNLSAGMSEHPHLNGEFILFYDNELNTTFISEPLITHNSPTIATGVIAQPGIFYDNDNKLKLTYIFNDTIYIDDIVYVPVNDNDQEKSYGLAIMEISETATLVDYEVIQLGKSIVRNIEKGENNNFYIFIDLKDTLILFEDTFYIDPVLTNPGLLIEINSELNYILNSKQFERKTHFIPKLLIVDNGIYFIDGLINTPVNITFYSFDFEEIWSFESTQTGIGFNPQNVKALNDGSVFFGMGVTEHHNVEFPNFSIDTEDKRGILIFKLHPDEPVSALEHSVLSDFNIKIYPNPVNETLNIHFVNGFHISNVEISIYNVLGQKTEMLNFNVSDNIIVANVSEFKNGVYIIEINTGTQIYTKKFFKK